MKNYNLNFSSRAGVGTVGVVQIVFIILKLLKVISWSWWVVLIPLWIDVVLSIIILIIFVNIYRK